MAKKCYSYGMNVAIVDNNKATLKAAEKSVGEKILAYEMDVSKIDEWRNLKDKIESSYGRIDLLHLNAGIGLKSTWEDTSYFQRIMDVNLFGVIHGISTFLPSITASATSSNPAAIILTGSKQGITNPPGNPAYNASKSAVKTLAEHLSFDLRDGPVGVHLLVPGWVFTGLSGGGPLDAPKEKPKGAWTGEQAVEFLEKKMSEGRFYVICPDNDVSEEMDRKRMLWAVGDVVEGRPPLTRWRPEWKERAEEWMARQ